MQKVNEVKPGENTLEEARDRVNKLMNKNKGRDFDFDARLQEACEEVRQEAQKTYADNRRQTVFAFNELYCLRRNIGADGNNLSAFTQ